jgi:hypothetical protein
MPWSRSSEPSRLWRASEIAPAAGSRRARARRGAHPETGDRRHPDPGDPRRPQEAAPVHRVLGAATDGVLDETLIEALEHWFSSVGITMGSCRMTRGPFRRRAAGTDTDLLSALGADPLLSRPGDMKI